MDECQKVSRTDRSNYDRLSHWYDLLAAGGERQAQAAGLQMLPVKPGDIVLEIGSGTGGALLALAGSIGEAGQAIGFDLSHGMLGQAAVKLHKSGLSHTAALVRGDALQLPFQSAACDAVFMSFTLELFQPREVGTVLSECWRVLGDGGSLCVVAMVETVDPGLMSKAYGWAHRRWPEAIDCRPIDVQGAISQAGFQIQNARMLKMWGLPIGIVLAGKT